MKTVGVGIIGTGDIAGDCHVPTVQALDGASLVAVLSRDKAKGRDFLEQHAEKGAVVHTSLEDFVADPKIELVIVCSPDGLHAEHATACLNAGKHVLLEKPMATSAEDAQALVKLANANQLTLATGFHLRSHLGHRALYSQIEEGKIGALRHIRVIWAFPQKDDSHWVAKQELAKWWSLAAVGSHCIDLARWFADDDSDWKHFSSVINNNVWHGPHDETAVIAGQFSAGPTVEIVSSVQFGPYKRVEIFGEKGMAICEDTLGRVGAGDIFVKGKKLEFTPISPFVGQLEDIISCMESGKKPRADGPAGLRSVQDLLLAYDSQKS